MAKYTLDYYEILFEYLDARIKGAEKMEQNSFVDGYKHALMEALCHLIMVHKIDTERRTNDD